MASRHLLQALGLSDEREFNDALRRAIGTGINFFDNSDLYWKARGAGPAA